MNDPQIQKFIAFIRGHASRSAREMNHKWKLHWHHDRVGIVFDLRDDWRFFKRTYSDAFNKAYPPQNSTAACTSGTGLGSTGTGDVLANIRARLS
ncbi:hypothetical protein OMR07_17090 [Methylobacterium organophilum]|nr:hypothetical protein [Methylobacterium organophilum]